MVEVISDLSIAPVGADLTQEDLGLSVLRGLETMHRVDEKFRSGVSLVKGEWGVLATDGYIDRPTASPVQNTYLCFAGTDRFDSRATGQVTLIENSPIIVKTDKFEPGTYNVGDLLTVKDLGGGEAHVSAASTGEPALAKVREVGSGYLVYEVLTGGATAA